MMTMFLMVVGVSLHVGNSVPVTEGACRCIHSKILMVWFWHHVWLTRKAAEFKLIQVDEVFDAISYCKGGPPSGFRFFHSVGRWRVLQWHV